MNTSIFTRTVHICAAAFVSIAMSSLAHGSAFTVSGGSYTANVANRLNPLGNQLGTVTATYAGTSDQGANTHLRLINGGHGPWQVASIDGTVGNNAGDESATARVQLSQVYELNRLDTFMQDFAVDEYEIRVSPNGSTWTTVTPRQSSPGANSRTTHSFATQNVQYVEWQVFGPGTNSGGTNYAYMMEMQAFVSSSAATPPDTQDGYNISRLATVTGNTGWHSGADATLVKDDDPRTYAIPNNGAQPAGATALFDLGSLHRIGTIKLDFAYGQQWIGGAKIEISHDNASWATVVDTNSALGNSTYTFGPHMYRYVRISEAMGSGALSELMVFAVPVPEPTSGLVLLAGAFGLLRRKR